MSTFTGISTDLAYFSITDGVSARTLTIKLTDAAIIQQARNQLIGPGPGLAITGLIVPKEELYNPNYNFCFWPSSIRFVTGSALSCSVSFDHVNENIRSLGTSLLSNYTLCPMNSRVVSELDPDDYNFGHVPSKYYSITDHTSLNNFIIKLTNPDKIAMADAIYNGQIPDSKIKGNIITTRVSYNTNWRFHLDPDSIEFFSSGFTNNDVSFDKVENNLANVGITLLPDKVIAPAKSCLVIPVTVSQPQLDQHTQSWHANIQNQSILLNNQKYLLMPEWSGTYAVTTGSLPQGLVLTNTGVITGHVNIAEPALSRILSDHAFTVSIIDQHSLSYVRNIAMTVVLTKPYHTFNYDQKQIIYTNNQLKYYFTDHQQYLHPGSQWRVSEGTVPTNTVLSGHGEITVSVTDKFQPFLRQTFIANTAPGTDLFEPQAWQDYLQDFLSQPQKNDYQFFVELVTPDNLVLVGHSVRITWFSQPLWSSWFQLAAPHALLWPDAVFYYFSVSEIEKISWITQSGLIGSVINGDQSRLVIQTQSKNAEPVYCEFAPNITNRFPQGLKLQHDGMIVGRSSFRCHQDDPHTVPVDDLYEFTVRAWSENYDSYSDRRFSIKIQRIHHSPKDNIWINAYPYIHEREIFYTLINDPAIFPHDLIYRLNDPWHGKASRLKILFAAGINPKTPAEYETILQSNHYDKTLIFGPVNTACYVNDNLQIEYEVVYVTIIDKLQGLNPQSGEITAFPHEIDLRPFIANYHVQNGQTFYMLKTNSLQAMRAVISASAGPNTGTLIPEWMTCPQPLPDRPGFFTAALGFKPVVVLAYCVPGGAKRIAHALTDMNLNRIRFEFDRYQLENRLSMNYDRVLGVYRPGTLTTIDGTTTVFDSNTTVIMEGLDYYEDPETLDKYLKFPKVGVFR